LLMQDTCKILPARNGARRGGRRHS